jgi:hypothetical protein
MRAGSLATEREIVPQVISAQDAQIVWPRADDIEVAGYPFHCQPTRAPPAAADRLGRAAAYAGPKAGRAGVATAAATSAGPCTRPFRCESNRQLGVRPRRRRRLAPGSSGARRLAVKWIANSKYSPRRSSGLGYEAGRVATHSCCSEGRSGVSGPVTSGQKGPIGA